MKLLVVDDNADMRRLLRNLLEDVAEQIDECADGIEALVAYMRFRPDWVLMDIKMKALDGIEASSRIMATFPDAKILIVTDYDDEELRDEARRAGACGYVVKDNLIAIREILSGRE
jgi:CheY-like chemotaxis protein